MPAIVIAGLLVESLYNISPGAVYPTVMGQKS
jgi:hypothetical protein